MKNQEMTPELAMEITKALYQGVHDIDALMLEINTRVIQERGVILDKDRVHALMSAALIRLHDVKEVMNDINKLIINQ